MSELGQSKHCSKMHFFFSHPGEFFLRHMHHVLVLDIFSLTEVRYKTCYFARAWSPSSVPILPQRPDPFARGSVARNDTGFAASAEHNASMHPRLQDNKGPGMQDSDGRASGNTAPDVDLRSLEGTLECSLFIRRFPLTVVSF